jgi:hypothetical protein
MFATAPSIAADMIAERLRRSADADADETAAAVTWHVDSNEVLLLLDSLSVTDTGDWRHCELELESGESGRSRVRFAFHAGVNAMGDSVRACATLSEVPSPVLDRCVAAVEVTLWEALL